MGRSGCRKLKRRTHTGSENARVLPRVSADRRHSVPSRRATDVQPVRTAQKDAPEAIRNHGVRHPNARPRVGRAPQTLRACHRGSSDVQLIFADSGAVPSLLRSQASGSLFACENNDGLFLKEDKTASVVAVTRTFGLQSADRWTTGYASGQNHPKKGCLLRNPPFRFFSRQRT